jgi:hypothetical protein
VEESGDQAERYAENERDQDGGKGELKSGREVLGQIGRHWALS